MDRAWPVFVTLREMCPAFVAFVGTQFRGVPKTAPEAVLVGDCIQSEEALEVAFCLEEPQDILVGDVVASEDPKDVEFHIDYAKAFLEFPYRASAFDAGNPRICTTSVQRDHLLPLA